MSGKITIEVGDIRVEAELNNTETARLIWEALPIEATTNTWGDEIYFDIPVKTGLENGVEIVDVGDLGYWPQGSAFCIFFGPTPMSRGDEIRPASAVNIVGKVIGDAQIFRGIGGGQPITLSQAG
jgi:hypothetical protein